MTAPSCAAISCSNAPILARWRLPPLADHFPGWRSLPWSGLQTGRQRPTGGAIIIPACIIPFSALIGKGSENALCRQQHPGAGQQYRPAGAGSRVRSHRQFRASATVCRQGRRVHQPQFQAQGKQLDHLQSAGLYVSATSVTGRRHLTRHQDRPLLVYVSRYVWQAVRWRRRRPATR